MTSALLERPTDDPVVATAPRDVIERATQLWVPTIVDGFPAGSLNPQWSTSILTDPTGSVTIGPSGGCILTETNGSGGEAGISSSAISVSQTSVWKASTTVRGDLSATNVFELQIFESSGDQYVLQYTGGSASFFRFNGASLTAATPAAASYSLSLESDGDWIWAFLNGQLVGCIRRNNATTTSLEIWLSIQTGVPASATIENVLMESLQPFLQRGSDKGDYVLPGDASTYPNGGLYARYFNDNDLQGDSFAISKVLAPTRTNAYLGSGGAEYMDQQDPNLSYQYPPAFTQSSPGPGTGPNAYWSCVWFGSVYLKLSQGDYTLTLGLPTNATGKAVRVWVGKTKFGDQLIDQWTYSGSSQTLTATISATTLAGTLPYGAGTIARDGWYPIKVEYSVGGTAFGGTAYRAPELSFTPPVSYTDPGGTSLTASTSVAIPATSLSPLGMVDQRYQGIAHYDLAQQTGQAYDYQLSVEPKQLESGLFPGVLAPRIREGHDTDLKLEPDNGARQDGEGIINYSSGLDATDFASSLQGNGAGFQNGNTGQLQAMVYDPTTMQASLFDVQQWTDFSDASFSSLLQALLTSQLSLQLEPWQLLSADPNGRPRQAFTWPLTGALAKMNWRPGDGLRIQARDINVWDTTPRQMLTITRNILPNGVTSTQASFALRPKTAARILKQQLYKATRPQRNYQKQKVTLSGLYVEGQTIAGGGSGTNSIIALQPGDFIVAAWLRITYNSASVSFRVVINAVDQTAALNGPWTKLPVNLNLMPIAGPDSANNENRFAAHVSIPGVTGSTFSYQLFVDVMR